MKATSGKWMVCVRGLNIFTKERPLFNSVYAEWMEHVEGSPMNLEQAKADVLLAAAAPSLLEACCFAKAQIKKGSPKKALPILRNAIAEAERGSRESNNRIKKEKKLLEEFYNPKYKKHLDK